MRRERQYVIVHAPFFKVLINKLSTTGFHVLCYIMEKRRPEQDKFYFLISEYMQKTGYKSKTAIYRGLAELLKANIIARGNKDTIYYINPFVVFKGERTTYLKNYFENKNVKDNESIPY